MHISRATRVKILSSDFLYLLRAPKAVTLPTLTEPEIRQRIWMELQRATQDQHHEWRTPVLATVDANGTPQARTVVLRQALDKPAQLQVYTDSRSPKVAELAAHSRTALVFWSTRLSWQLRVQADITVQTAGPEVDAAWARVSQSAAAGDYLSVTAPGAALVHAHTAPDEARHPHHLTVLTAQVLEIDWLELARSGHRRATISADTWVWRVP